jgi:predicted metalloprotease with PDZ domain
MAGVWAGLFIAGSAHAAPDPTVHYSLKPLLTNAQMTAVEFEMRFNATEAQTEVDLPDFGAGHYYQYEAFKDVEVTGATTVAIPSDQPGHRLITATPGAEIIVRFHVDANRKAGEEAPIATDMTYPVISPTRFTIMGETVWPQIEGGDKRPATFAADIPAGWTFVSNLEHLAEMGGTAGDVLKTILMGGSDVHVETIQTPHTRLRIATAGRFDFTIADFDDRVMRVIATEQAFWNDGQPDFLLTLAPMEPGHLSIHGEAMNGAFATIAVPDAPMPDIAFNLAHEYFHSWNPRKLGQYETPNPALGYWFSEGFTDYYGRKLALKGNVVSLDAFVADWNATLNRYNASKHKLAPNSDLGAHYGADRDWTKAIYDRGAVLAVYLNAEWRARGVTLDRFMHSLRDRVAADPAFGAEPLETRVKTVAAALGVPADTDLARFIDKGDAITLPADAFGGCVAVVTDTVADVDFGFDTKALNATHMFSGVKPDGPAYAAGLRDGMGFVHFSDKDPLDSSVPATFDVRDTDGKTRTLTYLPMGKTSHDRQQLVLPQGLTADQVRACTAAVTS